MSWLHRLRWSKHCLHQSCMHVRVGMSRVCRGCVGLKWPHRLKLSKHCLHQSCMHVRVGMGRVCGGCVGLRWPHRLRLRKRSFCCSSMAIPHTCVQYKHAHSSRVCREQRLDRLEVSTMLHANGLVTTPCGCRDHPDVHGLKGIAVKDGHTLTQHASHLQAQRHLLGSPMMVGQRVQVGGCFDGVAREVGLRIQVSHWKHWVKP